MRLFSVRCRSTYEYCGDVGEYAGDVGEYAGEVGEYAGDVGLTVTTKKIKGES